MHSPNSVKSMAVPIPPTIPDARAVGRGLGLSVEPVVVVVRRLLSSRLSDIVVIEQPSSTAESHIVVIGWSIGGAGGSDGGVVAKNEKKRVVCFGYFTLRMMIKSYRAGLI